MSGDLEKYKRKLDQKIGQRTKVKRMISESKKDLEIRKRKKEEIEQAIIVVQTVAKQTQKELEYNISELVTLAMAGIFDEPYEFELDFVSRRNKTETTRSNLIPRKHDMLESGYRAHRTPRGKKRDHHCGQHLPWKNMTRTWHKRHTHLWGEKETSGSL